MVPKEIKEYVKGLYGASPAPISEEIRKKIIGEEEVVTVRPADLLQPEIEKYRAEIGDLASSTEDLLSYILFPQVAKKFFENKLNGSEESEADANKEQLHHIYVTM